MLHDAISLQRSMSLMGVIGGLNERCAGAVEALAWMRNVLELAVIRSKSLVDVIDEVENVHDALMKGVAVDFERRVLTW